MADKMTYKKAGVDVDAGNRAVHLMKSYVESTFGSEVIGSIGGFGGLFKLDMAKYREPVLVSGTDGVGTKLKLAFYMDKHDTVGIDCVAMCVNDILVLGAKPLFFLDYIALGRLIPEKVAEIVKGVAEGCRQAGCALLGGETAEMPGMYEEDEYDLAGFAVGIVDKDKIIDGAKTKQGDVLIGLASSGIHSNGYSLVRRLFNLNGDDDRKKLDTYVEDIGCTVGEALLTPTRIYVKILQNLIEHFSVHAISHITGGGFIENIPRMLPYNLRAKIIKNSWDVLPIFTLLQSLGDIPERDMFNTFNMGIGMVFAVDETQADSAIKFLKENGEKAYIIGEVVEGENGVDL